ncbi:MAG: hypothetical protein ACLR56_11355 [Oscillospiraceae bacterium]
MQPQARFTATVAADAANHDLIGEDFKLPKPARKILAVLTTGA